MIFPNCKTFFFPSAMCQGSLTQSSFGKAFSRSATSTGHSKQIGGLNKGNLFLCNMVSIPCTSAESYCTLCVSRCCPALHWYSWHMAKMCYNWPSVATWQTEPRSKELLRLGVLIVRQRNRWDTTWERERFPSASASRVDDTLRDLILCKSCWQTHTFSQRMYTLVA